MLIMTAGRIFGKSKQIRENGCAAYVERFLILYDLLIFPSHFGIDDSSFGQFVSHYRNATKQEIFLVPLHLLLINFITLTLTL